MSHVIGRLALLAASILAVAGASAQSYPVKPVRMISMATGVADAVTRLMAQKMMESMGQPVVVEPQPGAGGAIGADQVAKSAPDGYTLYVSYPDPLVLRSLMVKNVPYDTLRDFTPVTMMLEAWVVFVTNPSVPANNLRELIDHAKANTGKLSYGTNGIGTSFQMAGEALKQHAGINILHLPFKSSPDGLSALLRGDISMIVGALGSTLPLAKSGKLKLISVVNDARTAALPELPYTKEIVPGFSSPPYWTGLIGPANLPAPVLSRLHTESVRAMTAPDVRSRAADASFTVVANSPEEFRKRIAAEIAASAVTAKASGIQPE